MAGAITFHQAGTIVAHRFLPLYGDVSGSEEMTTFPHTTTIVAQPGDVCTVYNDNAYIVYRHDEGDDVPATGIRFGGSFTATLTLRGGEVVTVDEA